MQLIASTDEAHRMLISVLNGMETIVYGVDKHTHELIFANEYTERSLNKQIKVGGICWKELECGQAASCGVYNNLNIVKENGKSKSTHVWEYCNSANHRWYQVQDHDIRWIDGRQIKLKIAADITAKKESELALIESDAQFRTMADIAPVIIWVADADREGNYQGCTFFNKGWQSFTGGTNATEYGFQWLSYIHPHDTDACLKGYLSAFNEKQPFLTEYRLRHHDGEYRWIRDNGVPRFTGSNGFLGFIGTCVDITEQKELETIRLQRQVHINHVARLNVAGAMASGLAHELSQPLSAANNYLQGCLGLIESGQHDTQQLVMAIKSAHMQTERAGKIISHLRNFIRKGKDDRKQVDINQLALGSIQFLDHEIKRRQINVSFNLSALPKVRINPIQIEQVLINLLKNAIESMHTTPLKELFIKTRLLDSVIEVEISDSGRGIPASEIDRIFTPFISSTDDGLGLGLSICHNIVESYGGKIRVSSTPDSGSVFTFTLPLKKHA